MRRRDNGLLAASAALAAFFFACAASASEPQQKPPENGKPDMSKYEVIRYLDPFSPLPPRKPEPPPQPKPPEPPPVPPTIVKYNPDNLHIAGATWEDTGKTFMAMIEVESRGTVFLKIGEKIGSFEVVAVDMEGVEFKDHEGKTTKHALGHRFHDGVTVMERTEGGSRPGPAPAQPAAAQPAPQAPPEGGPPSTLSEDQKREIIEKLKAKRAQAQGGK